MLSVCSTDNGTHPVVVEHHSQSLNTEPQETTQELTGREWATELGTHSDITRLSTDEDVDEHISQDAALLTGNLV